MPAQFQLVMRSGKDAGKIFPLEGNEITIGRDAINTIVINDVEVSRRHVRLVWQTTGYTIEDAGSTNGTFVNGQRVSTPRAVKPGDVISLGENLVLLVESTGDPKATMISSSGRRAVVIPAPAPAPVSAYPGQVPAAPVYMPAPPKKSSSKIWLIIIAAIILLCICAVGFLLYFFAPASFWCTIVPFLFPGACP